MQPASPAPVVRTFPEHTRANGLSLDGGGARGNVTLIILAYLEKHFGRPLTEIFPVWDGTSVGGLIACFLNVTDGNGVPKWKAGQMLEIFDENVAKIFQPKSAWDRLTSGDFALRSKYTRKGLEEVAKTYVGDALFKDSLCEINMPVDNICPQLSTNFSSRKARIENSPLKLSEAVFAATAAETYFDLYEVDWLGHKFLAGDGGTYRNNPTLHNYAVLNNRFPVNWPKYILSVGTGNGDPNLPRTIKNQGWIGWAKPISTEIWDSQSDDVDKTAKLILQEKVLRLNVRLDPQYGKLDSYSPAAMKHRAERTHEMLEKEEDTIKDFCNKIDPKAPYT